MSHLTFEDFVALFCVSDFSVFQATVTAALITCYRTLMFVTFDKVTVKCTVIFSTEV